MPRGWKKYPGFGPWSHLPPWNRPGWRYITGEEWQLPTAPSMDELELLEKEAKYLENRLVEIRDKIERLKKQKYSGRDEE